MSFCWKIFLVTSFFAEILGEHICKLCKEMTSKVILAKTPLSTASKESLIDEVKKNRQELKDKDKALEKIKRKMSEESVNISQETQVRCADQQMSRPF